MGAGEGAKDAEEGVDVAGVEVGEVGEGRHCEVDGRG